MSEPWWEILHTALKTATELDMEIGIFNSPGWSQSGGPLGEAGRVDALSVQFAGAGRGPFEVFRAGCRSPKG